MRLEMLARDWGCPRGAAGRNIQIILARPRKVSQSTAPPGQLRAEPGVTGASLGADLLNPALSTAASYRGTVKGLRSRMTVYEVIQYALSLSLVYSIHPFSRLARWFGTPTVRGGCLTATASGEPGSIDQCV